MKHSTLAQAAVLAAAISCGGPADGPQPLLGVHGSFEVGEDVAISASQAAIVYESPSRHALRIVDADADAELPDRFDLRVWDPPPDDVFAEFVGPDAEPNTIAIGYLAAVSEEHTEYAPRISIKSTANQHRCRDDDPDDCFCPPEGCLRDEQWCIEEEGGRSCFRQSWLCPELDTPQQACKEFKSDGDPNIARQPWVSIQGVSQNYFLLYLKRQATAWSFLAAALGSESSLGAGYHLISVRPMTDEERIAAARCTAEAEEQAADRYNKEHGTSYGATELKNATCPLPGHCLQDAFSEYIIRAKHKHHCQLSERILRVVSLGPKDALAVQLKQETWSPLSAN